MLVLVLYDFGYVVRMVRASMAEVMNKPYIRTADPEGHADAAGGRCATRVRNAMIAPFTVILLQINFLISGVVVTETVFAYPGFGRMMLEASLFKDISLIEAATLVALSIAICTQIISDIGYALAQSADQRCMSASHARPSAPAAAGRRRRSAARRASIRRLPTLARRDGRAWRSSLLWIVLALAGAAAAAAAAQRARTTRRSPIPLPSAAHLLGVDLRAATCSRACCGAPARC